MGINFNYGTFLKMCKIENDLLQIIGPKFCKYIDRTENKDNRICMKKLNKKSSNDLCSLHCPLKIKEANITRNNNRKKRRLLSNPIPTPDNTDSDADYSIDEEDINITQEFITDNDDNILPNTNNDTLFTNGD